MDTPVGVGYTVVGNETLNDDTVCLRKISPRVFQDIEHSLNYCCEWFINHIFLKM